MRTQVTCWQVSRWLPRSHTRESGERTGVQRGRTGSSKIYYNCNYMSQITIYLDDETEKLVKQHVKGSGESASKWIAGAIQKRARSEWPADVLAVFGSWKDDDYPSAAKLRK